jgi:protein-L-isoaspartate(D-aspartate) O-methyltransferase
VPDSVDDAVDRDHERSSERERMVQDQIVARGITEPRVVAALRRVQRHRFVPGSEADQAYTDRPLPIGWDQTISQPYVVAFMTAALALDGEERVLEIGTGSGYQAAILAELAREVWTIEIVEPLAERARKTLEELGYRNVHVRAGDGYLGWPEAAPFDAIMVTAAPDHVPQPLLDQLAVGGKMIVPVGERDQRLVVITRTSAGYTEEEVLPVRFVPMTGIAEER